MRGYDYDIAGWNHCFWARGDQPLDIYSRETHGGSGFKYQVHWTEGRTTRSLFKKPLTTVPDLQQVLAAARECGARPAEIGNVTSVYIARIRKGARGIETQYASPAMALTALAELACGGGFCMNDKVRVQETSRFAAAEFRQIFGSRVLRTDVHLDSTLTRPATASTTRPIVCGWPWPSATNRHSPKRSKRARSLMACAMPAGR